MRATAKTLEDIKDEDLKETLARQIEQSNSIKDLLFVDYTNLNMIMVVFDQCLPHNNLEKLIKDGFTHFYGESTTRRGTRIFKKLDNVSEQKDFIKNYGGLK